MNITRRHVVVGAVIAAALAVGALAVGVPMSQAAAGEAGDAEARHRIAAEALHAAVAVNDGHRGWSLTNGTDELRVVVSQTVAENCGPVTVDIVATRVDHDPVVAELRMTPAPGTVDASGCATEFVPELVFLD